MHGLAVYMKKGLPFTWGLSLENSAYFNVFVFGNFNISHKVLRTIFRGTDISGDLKRSSSYGFWIDFILLMLLSFLQRLSVHWEILIMLFSQFPLTFYEIHNEIPCSIP